MSDPSEEQTASQRDPGPPRVLESCDRLPNHWGGVVHVGISMATVYEVERVVPVTFGSADEVGGRNRIEKHGVRELHLTNREGKAHEEDGGRIWSDGPLMVRRGGEGSAVEMIGLGEGMDTKLRRKILRTGVVEHKKEEVVLRKTKQESNFVVGNRSWPGRWIKKPEGKTFGYEGINHGIHAGIRTWHV